MTKTMREHILDEAKRCVLQDRNLDYDSPENNFQRIADLWNVYLGDKLVDPILPHDTAVMAIMIKIARIMQSPSKEDHWVDISGYSAAGAECIVNKTEPGHEREAWDWSEVFKDVGGVDHGHKCKVVTIKNPNGKDSYMYDNGATLGTNCAGCGARIDSVSIYLSDDGGWV